MPRPGAGLRQRPAPRRPGGGRECHHDVSKTDISPGFNLKQLSGRLSSGGGRGNQNQLVAHLPSESLVIVTY